MTLGWVPYARPPIEEYRALRDRHRMGHCSKALIRAKMAD
jgi:hypothetical protein